MTLFKSRFLAAVNLVMLFCSVSSAGTMSLGSFMGSTVSFNNLIENDGEMGPFTTQLYNSPSVVGDTLSFDTSAFVVSAVTPNFPEVLDHSISFEVVAKPGQSFSFVTIQESFLAETSGSGLVQGFYGGPANVPSSGLIVADSASSNASGNSGGVLTPAPLFFFFPTPVTQANFTIDNRLTAIVFDPNSGASIQKTGLTITVGQIPEPTSAMIFACGALGLVGVRRRTR